MPRYILKNILILGLLCSVVACSKKPQEIIVRKWKMDLAAAESLMQDETKSPEQKKMIEALLQAQQKITIEFKEDGHYEKQTLTNQKGTWTLSEDGKTLITAFPDNPKQVFKVKLLTSKNLVIDVEGEETAFVPF